MKTLLVFFTLFIFGSGQNPIDKLIGKWKLEKVELKDTVLYPDEISYYLSIYANGATYSTECGSPVANCNSPSVTDSTLTFDKCAINPVLIICPNSPIGKYIDYNGSYTLHDSLLIIPNSLGKHYLIRQ